MIGLALVTLVATLAAGITSTFRGAVNEIFTSDYAITAQNNFSPIPTDAAEAVAKAAGVKAVASTRTGEARVFDRTEFVTAVDPDADQVLTLRLEAGLASRRSPRSEPTARSWTTLTPRTTTCASARRSRPGSLGQHAQLQVKGIFEPPAGGSPFGHVTFSSETFDREYESPRNLYTFVLMDGGVTDANTAALESALAGLPQREGADARGVRRQPDRRAQQILNILYVLLALSVIVSLFGIVNTLVLTVFERTRELGMLRAIGMTRRQVRRMIRHESVITALIGGTLGIALGVVLGALLIARVDFIEFSLPVAQIDLRDRRAGRHPRGDLPGAPCRAA